MPSCRPSQPSATRLAAAVIAALAGLAPTGSRAAPGLQVSPDDVDIGEVEAVELSAEGAGTTFAVEAGRVEPLPPRDGRVRGRWILPRELTPRRLAAAAVDRAAGTGSFAVIAVRRRARLHVTASPHARLTLRLGGAVVAEGQANAFGRLDLSVLVPPAVNLADVTQEVAGKSDAARKLEELDVRNDLHVFGVVAGLDLVADGAAEVPVLFVAYRDDGRLGAVSVAVEAGDGRRFDARTEAAGVYRARVRAGPWVERVPPPELALTITARDGAASPSAALKVPLRKLPPQYVRLTAPALPWEAGEVYEVTALVTDAAGRVMDEVPVAAQVDAGAGAPSLGILGAGVAPAGGQRWVIRTPQRLSVAPTVYSLRLRTPDGGPEAMLPITVRPASPAAIDLGAPDRADGGAVLALVVRDRFGNRVTSPAPAASVSEGSVSVRPADRPGELDLVWHAPDPRHSSRALVEAGFPGTSVRATARVSHDVPRPLFDVGLYAAWARDGATVSAPGGALVLSLHPRTLHDDLSLVLALGLARATRTQAADTPLGTALVSRASLLLPMTLGAEWRLSLARRLLLRAGAGAGALLVSVSTQMRAGEVTLQPRESELGLAFIGRAALRLGVSLGPGEVSLMADGWAAANRPSAFASRPRALTLGAGYIVDLVP